MKYYLIAGEASGDLHGSNLMAQLKKEDPEAQFRFFGGDLMQNAGDELVKHYREMAFMGIVNVLLNLKTINRNLNFCKKDILQFRPDVIILIDYPGFNLRVAEFAKKHEIKVFYYISPKVWAWKEYRVKKIRKVVDELFTILPFETEFYKKHGMDVHYVGNPLLDSVASFKKNALPKNEFLTQNNLDERPMVALLAGSRTQEIKRTLPMMVKVAELYPEFQFVVAGVNSIDIKLYLRFLSKSGVKIIYNQTYDLLNNAHTALVASGTAALETALFNVPQTVIYKVEGGWLVDFIMRNFVFDMAGVSLPNIIMNREIVREFIQVKMTLKNVKNEMQKLLFDEDYRNKILDDYSRLKNRMGEPGTSHRAAKKMVELLK
ncbi:lipid-A-disaccharide synthase [Tangfeifania diversioriginum]|uniref:Lipid-A-disaccharide synthase n=1 Tax=Tangfeifania diversioriginum TaxID=1168035 RepID=A0A1M6N8F5_9BACT|nr:lipid-A-disaccharide synthase [Tangfeifania diversioriginum]SHJ92015.1 lipid-A-disaccharide synthase [Tangfeifania diversioriginum]